MRQKNILKNLDEPVTVSAYFTEGLPQAIAKTQTDLKEMLVEYSTRSKGMVNYEFIDPSGDPEREQEAMSNGIPSVNINVREKDEVAVKKAYMGVVVKAGELVDPIPVIQPGNPLEYMLTTSIKKLTVADKPSVGLIQGHGEPRMDELSLLVQSLNILYNVENIDLNSMAEIPPRIKALMMIRPLDTVPPGHLAIIDQYLENGGNMAIALNTVDGDFQTAQGKAVNIGMSDWFADQGLAIDERFVIDASCGTISVQQRQGFFTINSQVQFPYFPRVTQFPDHPVTKGLEQVMFQFASPINFIGDSLSSFTPIVRTSAKSGILNLPLTFNVEKQWKDGDFPMSNTTIAGVLEKNNSLGTVSRIIIFSDGDFPIAAQGRGQTPDNISLFSNAIDWLSDDTGLIDLRTKGVASRPIEEVEDAKRAMIKWTNFLLPIALVIGYGIFRFQMNRRKRRQRMNERYV